MGIGAFALLRRLVDDRRGNFGIMTAVALPVLVGAAGMAVDLSNMLLSRGQLQEATDAAALGVATGLARATTDTSGATQLAKDLVAGQMANYLGTSASVVTGLKNATNVSVTTTANGATGKTYTVSVSTNYSMSVSGLTHVLGWNTVNVATSSTTSSSTETKNALSMYLVLDRSGSMAESTDTVNAEQPTTTTTTTTCTATNRRGQCTATQTTTTTSPNYYTKIEALRIATSDLMAQLAKADPNTLYVRTGAVSYNQNAQTPSALAWGENGANTYVQNLTASGNTDSSDAFQAAYDGLMASTENEAHKNKNGQVPTKYIVFMTDGENNQNNADKDTKTYCDKARTASIQVYTVALMAPAAGQSLLNYCATSSTTYFKAEDSDDLIAAFKAIGEKASQQLTLLTR